MLDDVFAELDAGRRDRLAELAGDAEQVLVTAAVLADVPPRLAGAGYTVADGVIEPCRVSPQATRTVRPSKPTPVGPARRKHLTPVGPARRKQPMPTGSCARPARWRRPRQTPPRGGTGQQQG